MNGVVFHTSARMISPDGRPLLGQRGVAGGQQRGEVAGVRGPGVLPGEGGDHGDDAVRDEDRGADVPRPKIARCMTRASAMPRTSSTATETAVMNRVTQNASHQNSEESTAA